MYSIHPGENPITIATHKFDDGSIGVGVTRYGPTSEEEILENPYSEQNGLKIARSRAKKTPFFILQKLSKNAFDKYIVPAIISNVLSQKEIRLQNFRRIRTKQKETMVEAMN